MGFKPKNGQNGMFDQEDVVIRENMCIGHSKLVVSCVFSQHKRWDDMVQWEYHLM